MTCQDELAGVQEAEAPTSETAYPATAAQKASRRSAFVKFRMSGLQGSHPSYAVMPHWPLR